MLSSDTSKQGNFGTVFCDNAYYNKAIAASPVHALPGYIMGGLAWFVSTFNAVDGHIRQVV